MSDEIRDLNDAVSDGLAMERTAHRPLQDENTKLRAEVERLKAGDMAAMVSSTERLVKLLGENHDLRAERDQLRAAIADTAAADLEEAFVRAMDNWTSWKAGSGVKLILAAIRARVSFDSEGGLAPSSVAPACGLTIGAEQAPVSEAKAWTCPACDWRTNRESDVRCLGCNRWRNDDAFNKAHDPAATKGGE